MELSNSTKPIVTKIVLLCFSHLLQLQKLLFFLFLVMYILTLLGNTLVILLIRIDQRLHTPMYYFLKNLSWLEIIITTSDTPKMLTLPISKDNTISLSACALQGYVYFVAGSTEVLLLAAMSVDRFVAICIPLRYTAIMNSRVCLLMVLSWICYTSTTVPKMLWDLFSEDKSISFIGCALQMYFFVILGGTECVLLSAMAYDRYAAICHPLHYSLLLIQPINGVLLAISWIIGNINSVVNTALIFSLDFCHSNEIDHFFCDIPPILHLSCSDVFLVQLMNFTISVCVIIVPFSLTPTFLSYILIVSAVLKIQMAHGRIKAFSTCASHLTVLSIFYGTIIYTCIRPFSNHSLEEVRLVSVLYAIITPLLNPLIYSIRNKEVQGAFRRALGKNRL
ncbi:olfactory receptor 5F1-like [Tiliqua scincoides]|uniref:olfactory receptor 5F1-like n=1 Tax=Tiliqua scincoides TaxID=71010 RepID=UPI0034625D6C